MTPRYRLSVPTLKSKLDESPKCADFWRRLMTPPVVPRPEGLRRRALQDLDFFRREAVAHIDAEIAQAVEVEVALGFEAADAELVAVEAATAFADRDGHARHVAQRLLD